MKYIRLFIVAFLIVTENVSFAMSFFKTEEVDAVLFSEMSGIITYNGEPAKGVSLDLSVTWNEDEKITDTFTTNEDGYFFIPQVEKKITTHPLVQLAISQVIIARYNGESYELWIRGKLDTKEHSETDGKPENFRCELTDPLIRIEVKNGQLGTSCKWKNS